MGAALLGIFGIVPGWVWAAMLAASVAHGCVTTTQRDSARLDVRAHKAAIDKQKSDAAITLSAETAKVLAAERRGREFKDAQEAKDATNKTKVDDLQRLLRVAAVATGRLRDPNAAGCGGGNSRPETATATGPADRAADGAENGGLFSAAATRLFGKLTREADEINLAYASCKSTLMAERIN